MSEYKGIKGLTIQEVASDPPAPLEGQVWYNTTASALKTYYFNAGTWSSANTLNDLRGYVQGIGTQTAALGIGGYRDPEGTEAGPIYNKSDKFESYNGTNWTVLTDLPTPMNYINSNTRGGAGTQTSALVFAGSNPSLSPPNFDDQTDSYNGTNWTTVNNLTYGRKYLSGFGASNTSAIALGGSQPSLLGDANVETESWNGTNWTSVNSMNTKRFRNQSGSTGTATAGLVVSGQTDPGSTTNVESWNGTNWTEIDNYPTPISFHGVTGSQTAAVVFGGYIPPGPPRSSETQSYNGTVFNVVGSMASDRSNFGSGGTSNTSALAFTGQSPYDPKPSQTTEEFNAGFATATWKTE